jgi:hypothetical protein
MAKWLIRYDQSRENFALVLKRKWAWLPGIEMFEDERWTLTGDKHEDVLEAAKEEVLKRDPFGEVDIEDYITEEPIPWDRKST